MPVVFTLLLTISLYAALLTDAIGEKPLSSVGDNPGADGSRSIFSSSAETAWPVGIEKITNLSYSSGSRESYQSPNSLRSNEDLEIARDSEIAVGELRALLAKHSIDRRLEPGPLLPSENQFLSETILDQPLKILRISAYRDEPNVRAVDPRSANYDDVFAFEPKAKGDGQLLTPDNSPKNASAALFPLGEAKLLPTSNFFGRAVFIYFLGNSDGANPWVRAQVTNAEANIDPTAVDDEFSLLRNEILEISTTALTDNDIEPNGDDLLVSSTRNAQNGTVFFVGDFIRFEPTFDFVGTASFEYVLTDNNGGSAIGSVFINYSELNNPPVAASDSLEGVEDSTLDIPISVLLENDFDPEGDPLAISSVQNIAGGIPNLVNSDTVQFVPSVNFFGNASFSYWVTDGESETRAEVTIDIASVNDPPVALNDSFHTGIDVPLAIPASDLLSNDYDVDGDPIGIVSVAGSRNGATSLDEFGSVQFVPDDSFTGIAEFSYQVEDGEGGRASAQVIIDVGKQFAVVASNPSGENVLYWNGSTGEFLGEFVSRNTAISLNLGGLSFGPDGNLYVAWSGNRVQPAAVRKYDRDTGAYLGDFAEFSAETDDSIELLDVLAFAPNGQLLVFDNGGLKPEHKMFRFHGPESVTAGAFIDEFITVNEFGSPQRRLYAYDIEFDRLGRLFTPDRAWHSVIYFEPPGSPNEGKLIDVFASAFEFTEPLNGYIITCINNGFNCQTATTPMGLAWGPDGNLYVSAGEIHVEWDRILMFNPDGQYIRDFVSYDERLTGGLRDIDFGPDGNLYVTQMGIGEILVFSGPASASPGTMVRKLKAPSNVTFSGSGAIDFRQQD